MSACIVVPAYNAEATIRKVTEEVLAFGIPVAVVDDGSTDRTSFCLDGLPVHLIKHSGNRGKGAALKSGFQWALNRGFSAVVTIDADGQHDASAIPLLLASAEKSGGDIVIASRFAQFQEMAGLRRWWNRFGAWCMRKLTGFDIDDSQSGFRCYSAELLKTVELVAGGYQLEMEILLKAWKGGFSIVSIPVPARVADGRSTSHYRAVRDTWKICMTFLRHI